MVGAFVLGGVILGLADMDERSAPDRAILLRRGEFRNDRHRVGLVARAEAAGRNQIERDFFVSVPVSP